MTDAPSTPREHHTPTPRPNGAGVRVRTAALVAAVLVAALLVFAAVMKLNAKPFDALALKDKAQSFAEIGIALLVLVFHRWRVTWVCNAALFSAFTGVTLHLFLTGAGSCGCFGKLSPPPAVTMAIDTVIVIASITLARALGAQRGLLAFTGAALVPFLITGAIYSKHTAPPPARDFRIGDRLLPPTDHDADAPQAADDAPDYDPTDLGAVGALLLLPRVADRFLEGAPEPEWMPALRAASTAGPDDPAWLIFVYDPFCEVCMRFQPTMLMYTTDDETAQSPVLRVALIQKSELQNFDIPDWAWPASPTTALFHRGRVIHEWGGDKTPNPFLLHDDIAEQGETHLRELRETYVPLIAR